METSLCPRNGKKTNRSAELEQLFRRGEQKSKLIQEQILELSKQLDETLHPSAEIKKRTSRKRTNPLPINPRLQKIPRIAADENFGYGYQPIPDEDRIAEVQNKFCLDTVSLFAKMNGGNRQRKPLEKTPEPRPSAAELYGEHSQRIRAMETALDIQFEFLMERRKPVRWPKRPTSGAQRF
ncbi:unnamed protein product, partial [Mesorhabditis spiculigera]